MLYASRGDMDKRNRELGFVVLILCTLLVIFVIYTPTTSPSLPLPTPLRLTPDYIGLTGRLSEFHRLLLPYNVELDALRTEIRKDLEKTGRKLSSFPVLRNASAGLHSDFFQRLNGTGIKVIKMSADNALMSKLLPSRFESFGNTAAVKFNKGIRDTKTLNSSEMNFKSTRLTTFAHPGLKVVGNEDGLPYMLVVTDAYVTSVGAVYKDGLQIDPGGCRTKSSPSKGARVLPEVFTISQFWGYGFYHATNENIPRAIPWLPFLRNHSEIYIHVENTQFPAQFLGRLGIAENRFVTGDVRGKIVYMPDGTRCGFISLFHAQLLNLELRKTIDPSTAEERNKVVLIKRSTRRWFNHHNVIEKGLRQMALEHGLELVVFDDKRMPSFPATIRLFNQASLVVGPHGAGLSNILFSTPGTVVVEGACPEGTFMNACYQTLTNNLAMLHLMFVNGKNPVNCKDTDPVEFLEQVKIAIKMKEKIQLEEEHELSPWN